jgi:hypothetical protein
MTNRILEVYKRAIREFEGYGDLRLPPEFANLEDVPNAVDEELERFK